MINTPWIFRGRETTWRHGLQCDYPSYEGPRLSKWSGIGVSMKEDEGKKKIMVISHRQNYPPRISFRYLYVQQRIYHNFIPTPKTQNYFCFSQTPFTIGSEFLPASTSHLHRFNGGGPPGASPLFLTSEGSAGVRSNGGGPLGALPPFFIIEGSAGVH